MSWPVLIWRDFFYHYARSEAGQRAIEQIRAEREGQVRAEIVLRLESEIGPLIAKSTSSGGYDCCGCSTYDDILEHAKRIAAASE